MPKPKHVLNERQKLFVEEYLVSLNGRQAYQKAYGKKAKPESADTAAWNLLSRPHVQEYIRQKQEKKLQKIEIKAETVLGELLKIATSDIGQAYNEDGSLKHVKDMPEEIRKSVSGVESLEVYEGSGQDRVYIGDTKKLKLWDKTKALEMLGRHLKLYTDVVEHKGTINLAERLSQARKRKK